MFYFQLQQTKSRHMYTVALLVLICNIHNVIPEHAPGPRVRHQHPVKAHVVPNRGRPGLVLYNLKSTNIARVDYTVKCLSLDTKYTLSVFTSNPSVATVKAGESYNVSCADAMSFQVYNAKKAAAAALPAGVTVNTLSANSSSTSPPEGDDDATNAAIAAATAGYVAPPVDDEDDLDDSLYVGVVTGKFNVTLKAKNIGRSFFVVIAKNAEDGPNSPAMQTPSSAMGRKATSGRQIYNESNIQTDTMGIRSSSGDAPTENDKPTSRDSSTGDALAKDDQHKETKPGGAKPAEGGKPFHGRRLHKEQVGLAMVIVMQLPRPVDTIFRWVLMGVIVLATAGMGLKVNVKVVLEVLKKPVGPIIGLVCQFLFMPLIAYAVARSVPQESAAIALGIFTCGTVPGGGVSNMFCFLLDGDVSLSVTMTTLSSIAALGMTPLWIFTLGSTFKDDTIELKVPYLQILEKLALVIAPLFVGIFIQIKLPKVEKLISKVLKPVIFVMVAGVIALGVYTNMHVFQMIRPMVILAGCLLPYCGYIVGATTSLVCCQTWRRIKTIAIETGIQNTGIAFLMLYLSLPPPDNQLAAVGPAASAIMTPQPLFITVIIYLIYKRCNKKDGDNDNEEKDDEDAEEALKIKGEGTGEGLLSSSSKRKEARVVEEGEKDCGNRCTSFLNETKGKPAFVVLWEKLTGDKQPDIAAEMLTHEMTVPSPSSTTDDKSELWSGVAWDKNSNFRDGSKNGSAAL